MLTENPADPLILLVEDDPGHSGAIQRSFQTAPGDFRLEIVTTLNEAWGAISRRQPALVLTDFRLPDGDGSEMAYLSNGTFPVVVMTAKGSEQIAVNVLKAGVQDYVVKSPELFSRMPETVNHALKSWALVQARKEAEETLRSYSRRLIDMEEDLRKIIATELHDEIAQDLTVLGMNLSIISSNLPQDAPKNLHARIEDSTRLLEGVSRTTRNIMSGLRPPVLDDYGLVSALRWHAETFAKRLGIAVPVVADELFPRLPPKVELAFFRISQEALMNTAKHADAKCSVITLSCSNGMARLTVADDGKGFVPTIPSRPNSCSGWGMTIMRERAELVGAEFRFDSLPGHGTTVTVTIPLEDVKDACENTDCG